MWQQLLGAAAGFASGAMNEDDAMIKRAQDAMREAAQLAQLQEQTSHLRNAESRAVEDQQAQAGQRFMGQAKGAYLAGDSAGAAAAGLEGARRMGLPQPTFDKAEALGPLQVGEQPRMVDDTGFQMPANQRKLMGLVGVAPERKVIETAGGGLYGVTTNPATGFSAEELRKPDPKTAAQKKMGLTYNPDGTATYVEVGPGTTVTTKPERERPSGLNDYQQMMMMNQYQGNVDRWENDRLNYRQRRLDALIELNTKKVPGLPDRKPSAQQILQFEQQADAEFEKSRQRPKPPVFPGVSAGPSTPSAGKGGTSRWAPFVSKAAADYGVPEALLYEVMAQESGGNPNARSPVGAQGLMQLMPGTAAGLGVTNAWDPGQNIRGGAKYLRAQFDKFGSWEKALAAYNAGPGAVQKYGGVPPFKETRGYVNRIRERTNARAGQKVVALPAQVASFYERHGITPGASDA